MKEWIIISIGGIIFAIFIVWFTLSAQEESKKLEIKRK